MQLLARRLEGIFVSEFERDELGPTCFGRPASSDWRAWSLEAQGPALSRGAVTLLDQGEEPKSSGDRKSQGTIRVTDLNDGAVDGLVAADRRRSSLQILAELR